MQSIYDYNPYNNGLSNNELVNNADLTGYYYYSPAQFQMNYVPQPNQMVNVNQYYPSGYMQQNMVQPSYPPQTYGDLGRTQNMFGTLGYNPNVQSFNPQIQSYNPGAYPQYNNGLSVGQGLGIGNYNGYQQNNPYAFQYSDQTYIQEGFNPYNSNMMFSSNDLDRLTDIMNRMAAEQEEYANRASMNLGYMGYNYYGYMNYGVNPFIAEKYKREQYELEQEAIQRRINFNKRLSNIAHTYLGDIKDDDYYDDIYEAKEIVVPAASVRNHAQVMHLQTFTMDVTELEKMQYNIANNQITKMYHDDIIGNTSDMNDYFAKAGLLYAEDMQYEVERSKRDLSKQYSQSGFQRELNRQLIQRGDGTTVRNMFPNLTQNGSFLDDGTLQITPPKWMTDKQKQSEESYAQDKQRFIDSIYNPSRNRMI